MRRPLFGFCVGMILIVFLLQILFAPPNRVPDWLHDLENQKMEFTGEVTYKEKLILNQHVQWRITISEPSIGSLLEEPSDSVTQEKITILNQKIKHKKIIWETDGEAYLPGIGDKITLRGTFRLFSTARNPGQFDSYSYYYGKKIIGKITKEKLVGWMEKEAVGEVLFSIKTYFSERILQIYPNEEAAILMKMLLGDGSYLEKETKELYRDGGIMHILAISGLHISLLGMAVYKGCRKAGLPLPVSGILGISFLLFYGGMTGWSLSSCRAIGMYVVRIVGDIQRKNYDMLTAMGILALAIVCVNPQSLWQSSFWLSFGAVMGMGLVSETLKISFPCKKKMFPKWVPQKLQTILISRTGKKGFGAKLGETVISGIHLALFTVPIQLTFFYEYPLWSILINILVLPLLSILVCSTILSVCFPWIPLFSMLSCMILQWYRLLCLFSETLPFHNLILGKPAVAKVIIYYIVMGSGLWLLRRSRKKNAMKIRGMATVGLLMLLIWVIAPRSQWNFTMRMLDVGQGDGILIQNGKGQTYLFDAGSSTIKNVGENILVPALKYYGISRIDGIFLSHGDMDHISAVLELLDNFEEIEVDSIYIPDLANGEEFSELMKSVNGKKVRIQPVGKGDSWRWENQELQCLFPYKGSNYTDNEASACFLWEVEGVRILLTGDLEGKGEDILTQNMINSEPIDILKVAHHGSKYSSSEEFLAVVRPKAALISAGQNNAYGHPHKEILDRLEKLSSDVRIYRTDTMGRIEIVVKQGMFSVSTFLKP